SSGPRSNSRPSPIRPQAADEFTAGLNGDGPTHLPPRLGGVEGTGVGGWLAETRASVVRVLRYLRSPCNGLGTLLAGGAELRSWPSAGYATELSEAGGRHFLRAVFFFRQGLSRCQSPAMMQPTGSMVSTTSARPNTAICARTAAASL